MTSRHSVVRAPLHEALGEEIHALDLRLARAWQILGVVGIVGGLLVYWVLGFEEGPAVSAISVVGFAWFTVQHAWLERRPGPLPVHVGTFVEAIAAPAFLVAIGATRGPADALGSYVPPMVFTAVIVAAIARLRASVTVVLGVVNAVLFLAIYFGYLRGLMSPEEAARPLLSPGMQIVRALAFGAGSGLAYLVTMALRRAIGRAERSVRSTDLFGKYRLGDKIGSGGMGTVHRAVYCPEGGFERTVAVKLLHPHLADQPELIAAFRAEAELSARLVHANIVQVLDFGRFGDAFFLAMEHVDGLTLGSLLNRCVAGGRALDEALVAWIGQELLAGLAFSHDGARDAEGKPLRVVHRDLCPANVLVSASGDVKISDFGIAKVLGDASFSMTKTIAGHSGYMAPEQVRAEPVDQRADLFAFGVIVWELLAGEALFRRGQEGLTEVSARPLRVRSIAEQRAGLSPGWDGLFARCLAAQPTDRFESAGAVSVALGEIADRSVSRRADLAALVSFARDLEPPASAAQPEQATLPTEVDP